MSIAPDSALRAVADALRDDPFYVAITSSRAVAEKKQILLEYLDYSCREAARIGLVCCDIYTIVILTLFFYRKMCLRRARTRNLGASLLG